MALSMVLALTGQALVNRASQTSRLSLIVERGERFKGEFRSGGSAYSNLRRSQIFYFLQKSHAELLMRHLARNCRQSHSTGALLGQRLIGRTSG
jgi:hypothetical protein